MRCQQDRTHETVRFRVNARVVHVSGFEESGMILLRGLFYFEAYVIRKREDMCSFKMHVYKESLSSRTQRKVQVRRDGTTPREASQENRREHGRLHVKRNVVFLTFEKGENLSRRTTSPNFNCRVIGLRGNSSFRRKT